MLVNLYNLSDKFEENSFGLNCLNNTLKINKIYKAEIFDFQKIKKLLPFEGNFLFLTKDGDLYCDDKKISFPQDSKIRDVFTSTNWKSAFCITKNGQVFAWGNNDCGQLGVGDTFCKNSPTLLVRVEHLHIVKIVSGSNFTLFLSEAGDLYSCGDNWFGVLGTGTTKSNFNPVFVVSVFDDSVVEKDTGDSHVVALTKSGQVYTWGMGESGRLGSGSYKDIAMPVKVKAIAEPVAKIAVGRAHNFALTKSGKVYAWGNNEFGQLGTGNCENVYYPIYIPGFNNFEVSNIYAKNNHSFIVTKSGELYGWGCNAQGELGVQCGIKMTTKPILLKRGMKK